MILKPLPAPRRLQPVPDLGPYEINVGALSSRHVGLTIAVRRGRNTVTRAAAVQAGRVDDQTAAGVSTQVIDKMADVVRHRTELSAKMCCPLRTLATMVRMCLIAGPTSRKLSARVKPPHHVSLMTRMAQSSRLSSTLESMSRALDQLSSGVDGGFAEGEIAAVAYQWPRHDRPKAGLGRATPGSGRGVHSACDQQEAR